MSSITCEACGFDGTWATVIGATPSCPQCGSLPASHRSNQPDEIAPSVDDTPAETSTPDNASTDYSLEFLGSAREYFRIWIVNTLLTIVTLGFYAPWAKVRNRRYLYSHTRLDGSGFAYLANPWGLFRGYLIAVIGLALYTGAQYVAPTASQIVFFIGVLLFPWLAYHSLRFKAHNTSWRNIRFKFHGSLGNSYVSFLLIPLLMLLPGFLFGVILAVTSGDGAPAPATFGVVVLATLLLMAGIFPYWAWKKKHYVFSHIAFGEQQNRFAGQKSFFYKLYVKVFFLYLLLGLLVAMAMGAFSGMIFAGMENLDPANPPTIPPLVVFLPGAIAAAIFTFGQMFIYARETNYAWNRSNIGPVRVRSTMRTWDLTVIRLTNILAIILSFGLLIPWAQIRRLRYQLRQTQLVTTGFDDFVGALQNRESALGDAALDTFDFEIGL